MNRLTKLIFLVIIFIASSQYSTGQPRNTIKLSNHQIGVNPFQFTDLAHYDLNGSVSGNLFPSFGLTYKTQVKPHTSFRAFTSYFSNSSHHLSGNRINDASWDYMKESRKVDLTLGLEQHMSFGRISSYMFTDVFQQFGNRKRYGYSVSFAVPSTFDDSFNFYQLGLAAGVGVNLTLTDKFHLNIESHIRGLREFKANGFYDNRHSKYQAYFNPMSRLSLNYRL